MRIPLEVRLFGLVVHPALKLRAPDLFGEDLVELAREAGDAGLDAERSRALVLVARLYYHSWVDVPRSRAALGQAVALLEKDPSANAEALVSGLRCLALVHTDMARVGTQLRSLAGLGDRVTGSLYYRWGIGLVHTWEGDVPRARAALGDAVRLARKSSDHWAEYECSVARALLELESGEIEGRGAPPATWRQPRGNWGTLAASACLRKPSTRSSVMTRRP